MNSKIFLFILTVSVSLLVIGCVYNVISGKPWYANIMVQFFLNLPLCIGLGFIDFGVINLIYKRLKQRNNAVRILVDIVLTTALAVLLTFCRDHDGDSHAVGDHKDTGSR